jgi:hypothetical protein
MVVPTASHRRRPRGLPSVRNRGLRDSQMAGVCERGFAEVFGNGCRRVVVEHLSIGRFQVRNSVRPMHLFGHTFDHDYYFELPREGERDTQSISRCSTTHHRLFRVIPRANRTFSTARNPIPCATSSTCEPSSRRVLARRTHTGIGPQLLLCASRFSLATTSRGDSPFRVTMMWRGLQ